MVVEWQAANIVSAGSHSEGLLGEVLGMLQTPRKIWVPQDVQVSWTIVVTDSAS